VPPVWPPLPASATTSYVGIIYSVTFYLSITLDATYNFCFCFLRCQIHSDASLLAESKHSTKVG
jgi:hypothetical protein